MAHRSKWGWHPCDFATYRLLKELNRLFEKARRQYAAWQRWSRKAPHNRLLHRTLIDDQGNKVGREVVGPRPEPPLPPLFCVRKQVLTRWSEDGRPLKAGRLVETVVLDDHKIAEAYRLARHPKPTEQDVEPLSLSQDDVRRLAEQAGIPISC